MTSDRYRHVQSAKPTKPMSIIHHLTVFCLLPGCPLWRQSTVFAVFQQERQPKSVRRHFGSKGRDGELRTHTLPTLPLRITYEHQLSAGPLLPRERGWSTTPPWPLELGSGAQVTSQIHKETTIAYASTPKYREPGLSVRQYPFYGRGRTRTDRPSASAPERSLHH